MYLSRVGERVRQRRIEIGYDDQLVFKDALGTSQSYVRKIERGEGLRLRKVLLIDLLTLWIASQAGPVSAGPNVWTSIGPEGGRIDALAIDPATPGTLYAGTYGGGVFAMQQPVRRYLLPTILRGQ